MALVQYKNKRSFKSTPEPTGGKATGKDLIFVIQKHDASRLHYDFRIEAGGVLKSWAVPKGPSLNPSDKRLAMLVEDHPYDYKDFEGIIPEGNYGAGTVITWDQGTYEPLGEFESKTDKEKAVLKAFHAGQIKIRMHGEKLKGEFVLVKTSGRAENAWLLIKHRDEFATDKDVTLQDKSVVSDKTIDEMADNPSNKWKSNRTTSKKTARKTAPKKKPTTRRPEKTNEQTVTTAIDVSAISQKAKKSTMPKEIKPMLATLVDKPKDEAGWLYEVKWDGYRAVGYVSKKETTILSRNNKSFDKKFYPVLNALKDWDVNVVVDGEIVVMNEKGFPDFGALQEWRSEADGELAFYLFDILWYDGYNVMNVPLGKRKELLQQIVPKTGIIRLSETFDLSASEFFKLAGNMDLEGILAKKADSLYKPDTRSTEWLKIKTQKSQEAVIGGYTLNENSSRKISALLLGVYDGDEFVFIGPVGTGFTTKMQEEILEKVKPLKTAKCPFNETPEYNKPSRFRPNPPKAEVVWVKPKIIVEITYRTIAGDGSLRHPSFKGLREDKNPREVTLEVAELNKAKIAEADKALVAAKGVRHSGVKDRKTLLNPTDETQVRKIEGHDLKFTNLSKLYWPKDHVSKRDMLNYYYQMAPYMLPYYKDRPQTLNRFPNGIHGPSFYQKDVTGKVPEWIEKYQYYSETDEREKHFMVVSDEASLLYIASLGCIEINPWSSRTQKPDHPDWCIIDLDPDKNPFDQVIQAAQVTHEVLNAIGVPSYCKTSGSTGIHIYIPFGAKYTYEDSKEFGRMIVKVVNKQLPDFTSIERATANRKGKIYLDFLQNRPQATVAGPYSLRPKPGAPVSMPLHWEEVKKGLKITDFNIHNAVDRLKEHGDIFRGVLEKGIDRDKAVRKMEEVFR